jgi:hypothetical protein
MRPFLQDNAVIQLQAMQKKLLELKAVVAAAEHFTMP